MSASTDESTQCQHPEDCYQRTSFILLQNIGRSNKGDTVNMNIPPLVLLFIDHRASRCSKCVQRREGVPGHDRPREWCRLNDCLTAGQHHQRTSLSRSQLFIVIQLKYWSRYWCFISQKDNLLIVYFAQFRWFTKRKWIFVFILCLFSAKWK
jgi:hypothetical protein